ncbi:hypothetical protein K469DRAFT_690759 [Zopfia rhizophila CBS 207.26]|uniref:Uncharacterized protein n=1 Tax=Zopfia rhizophila CBS 207.26 TaxID=1314779 RepID=A0A6A6DYE6_9PEZI|nr:hypothetical protein K469DRAFT_690759 [Zopfia rhizophila CBS 207.26]
MNSSQNSNDSFTTINDDASGRSHADCRGKKRPHSMVEKDAEDKRPSIGGKVARTGKRFILTTDGLLQADLMVESMKTLAKRNNDLEARVEALEDAHIKLLDSFKDWAEGTVEFMKQNDFQRDGPMKWLTWHSQYMTKKHIEWAVQSKDIYLRSGGLIGDLEHLE